MTLAWGRGCKRALVALGVGCTLVLAEPPSPEALRAALPALQGSPKLQALLDLANALEDQAPKQALAFAEQGMALALEQHEQKKELAFLTTAAFCCSQTGDFEKGIAFGKRALVLGTALGNQDRVAKAHNALGITYTFIGAYSQALDESMEALRIREALGHEQAITQSMNLIGVVYHHSGQYEKAIATFNQILDRLERKPDPKRLVLAKLNIGFAQFKLGHFAEAMALHHEALGLAARHQDTTYLPYAHLNLGLVYSELKQFKQAQDYLTRARSEYRVRNQQHGLIQVANGLARMHLLAGRFNQGIPFAEEAATWAKQINARDELQSSYQLLAELHLKSDHIKESYTYYKLAVAAKESIFSIQESNKIAEVSMKMVTIKKDNEINQLNKEKMINKLKIEKQRYLLIFLISGVGFLAALILMLGRYSRRLQQTRNSLERSNTDLALINHELQEKMDEIKTLTGLLPICAQCKKIRNDDGYWTQLEGYISAHTSATFSHGICPQCAEVLYPEAMSHLRTQAEAHPPTEPDQQA